MPDATLDKIFAWLEQHQDELLANTQKMLRIPSLESDPEPNAPFGGENRRALNLALEWCNEAGMRTTDLEGYLGYGEFGEGDPMLLILGHLDVVPTGKGWKYDPFSATIADGYLYSRGATDDKGPTMAALYAARALKECVPDLGVRIRMAFGCNEESGFACVHRYMQTEEVPTFGIAPDSDWPLIHGEKGIGNIEVLVPIWNGHMQIVSIEGGQRLNIVMDECAAVVRVTPEARQEVEEKLSKSWDLNVEFEWKGDLLKIDARGKAAHALWPFGGDSAGIRLLRFLREIAPMTDSEAYSELFKLSDPTGVGIGIFGSDEPSGELTNNIGIITTTPEGIVLKFNPRYPVTWTGEQLREKCEAGLNLSPLKPRIIGFHDSPPLYFPIDSPLVKTICDVYEEETGEEKQAGVIGGGTYARAVPNTVSIGTCWTGDGKAHETDERIKVEHLFKASRIYAHILYRLAKLAAEK